jgi:RNA polymerase sigma-70 factor, ECF subfamily
MKIQTGFVPLKNSLANDVQRDDERLLSLIAQAHEEALARLYDRYNHLVFSIAAAIVKDPLTAEEITLDVFTRVWQKAGSYQSELAKVRTWLTHIARHHAIDVLRRRSVRPDHCAISWDEVHPNTILSGHDSQELVEIAQRREQVCAAIAQLPEDQKQALILAYYGGLTQLEIAEALKQPLGTIKTRLRLAMQKLGKALQAEQESQAISVADESMINDSAVNLTMEPSGASFAGLLLAPNFLVTSSG